MQMTENTNCIHLRAGCRKPPSTDEITESILSAIDKPPALVTYRHRLPLVQCGFYGRFVCKSVFLHRKTNKDVKLLEVLVPVTQLTL